MVVDYCDKCGKNILTVIVKNKRKETKVFCSKCGKLLRFANKHDKYQLRIMCGK